MTATPNDSYRAYTTKFDAEVRAHQLDRILGPLSRAGRAALDEAWAVVEAQSLGWCTQVHLAAAEADKRIRAKLSDDDRAQIVVTLLFDQSGSMRGQKMLFAAMTADVVREFLVTLGFRCEVLGFTTSRWQGGRSRKRWRWRLRPRNPGRLNDLLHIVYRSADDLRASTGGPPVRQMLRPDLPKENIDGEAILWAADRLSGRPEPRKYLIVLSDGAPVDDSTLMENGPDYLSDHLEQVVRAVIAEGSIGIAAMGIGYRAHDYYPVSAHVDAPGDLGLGLLSLVERLLVGA